MITEFKMFLNNVIFIKKKIIPVSFRRLLPSNYHQVYRSKSPRYVTLYIDHCRVYIDSGDHHGPGIILDGL